MTLIASEAAQPLNLEGALSELEAARRERDNAEGIAASAHHDKKELEAKLKDRRRQHNEALVSEHKFLEGAFNDLATEAFKYQPVGLEDTNNLELTKLGELLAEPEEDIEWLVDNCIAPGTINALAGPPKIGKSVLLRQMAVSASTGAPWLDRDCPRSNVCQTAFNIDPRSACKIDPPERHGGGCPGSQ